MTARRVTEMPPREVRVHGSADHLLDIPIHAPVDRPPNLISHRNEPVGVHTDSVSEEQIFSTDQMRELDA